MIKKKLNQDTTSGTLSDLTQKIEAKKIELKETKTKLDDTRIKLETVATQAKKEANTLLTTKKVYNTFWSDKFEKAFMHGPTFMGNPLACTIANTSIKIFEEEYYISKIKHIEDLLKEYLYEYNNKDLKRLVS